MEIDVAISKHDAINDFLTQTVDEKISLEETISEMEDIAGGD
jgi:flagellar biosynthesis/type III secretory pathway ATPase